MAGNCILTVMGVDSNGFLQPVKALVLSTILSAGIETFIDEHLLDPCKYICTITYDDAS